MPIECDRVAVHYRPGYGEKATVMCYREDAVYVVRHVDDLSSATALCTGATL